MALLHVSFYKFKSIPGAAALKTQILNFVNSTWPTLRGTVLLANEGINTCVCGDEDDVRAFMAYVADDLQFGVLDHKESPAYKPPYRRFVVKVKKEIISMGVADIDPAHFTGDYVESADLKRWLDEGREVVLLDTRNDYEVQLGTFKGAINPKIDTFRTFPDWVENNLNDKKEKVIVTFCTGGIRCEKATAYMRKKGFEKVYQLHGGILRYLEETKTSDKNHYDGDCFVFDYRVAVNKQLDKTQHEICFACWKTLSAEDLASPHYSIGKQCPYCYTSKTTKLQGRLQRGLQKNQENIRKRFERALEIKKQHAQKTHAEL